MGNPGDQFANLIHDHVRKALRAQRDAVEKMCEKMLLQDGTDYGVLVMSRIDWSTNSIETNISLSPEVPFGRIEYRDLTRTTQHSTINTKE